MTDPTSDTMTHSHGHVHDQLAYECGEDVGPWVEHTHASPQPDTAPEGPWTAENPTSATLWPSPLNGAPATPAERAVIDAAEAVADRTSADRLYQLYRSTASHAPDVALVDAVARLRSERNEPDEGTQAERPDPG